MQIQKEREDGVVVLKIVGQLVTATSPAFEAAVNDVFETEDKLILDFSELEFLASSGIRVILAAQKKVNDIGGLLIIRNVNDIVMNVFEMTGLRQFMDIR